MLFESLEERQLLAADLLVQFEYTDALNSPVASLQVGQEFWLNAYIQDTRSAPQGVFQAYFDVQYDAGLASVAGDIEHGDAYSAAGLTAGDTSTAGLIDDVGGRDTDQVRPNPRDAELLLFRVPFQADAAGTMNLELGLADRPDRIVYFFDTVSALPIDRIEHSGGMIDIVEAAIQVTPTTGLSTSEAGDAATFEVVLTSEPAGDVTIGLSSSDITEGVVSPDSLLFTAANWSTAQTVTVTGVDDFLIDSDVSYTIVTAAAESSDTKYDGLDPADVPATNTDNDAAGLIVDETGGTTEVSEDATDDTFGVALTAQPTSDVVVLVAASDTGEAQVDRSSLTFTPANWNVAQTVTVTGVDDALIDGNQTSSVVLSIDTAASDDDFDTLPDRTVPVTTLDNGDVAGIRINETFGSTEVSEWETVDTINISLTAQPYTDVVLLVSVSDPTEATLSATSLTFTPGNWNIPQPVDVTGVDDDLIDGTQTSAIEVSVDDANSDDNYDLLDDRTVTVTTTDNGDTAGFEISQTGGATEVSETGTTDTLTVVLTAQPVADVVLLVTASDAREFSADRTSLTFTPANWNMGQTVTVTGVDDALIDGDQTSTLTFSVDAANSDDDFDSLSDQVVTVTTTDDGDVAGFTVTETLDATEVSESGTVDTFDVRLTAEPTSDVTILVSPGDLSEVTVDKIVLTFAPASWNVPQTVTVTGVDDALADGDQTSTITLAIDDDTSDDDFDALADQFLTVVTTDDGDLAGFVVTETADGTEVSESGTSDTFAVVLTAQPETQVVILVSGSDPGEAVLDTNELIFTSANWDVAQSVTVGGVDDSLIDGDQSSTVTLSVDDANSDDSFTSLPDQTVDVLTRDEGDVAGFEVSETDGATEVSETGTADIFTVVLTAEPESDVLILVAGSDSSEAVADATTLTFSPGDWNVPQTVTVTGVDDDLVDGDQISTVTLSVDEANSDDAFDSVLDQVVSVTTLGDGDTAGFVVTQTSDTTEVSESGTEDTFDVVLTAQPEMDVVLLLSIGDPSEVALDVTSLVFTSASWNVPRTVTVTGVDDALIDEDQISEIVLAIDTANSDDAFDLLANQTVSVTTTDDGDVAGLVVTQSDDSTVVSETGSSDTIQVALTAEPASQVVILVSVSDLSEASLDTSLLIFSPGDWNVPQLITVTGVDDALIDGDQTGNVTLAVDDANSDDDFDTLPDQLISVTTTDDGDAAGVTITESDASTVVSESGTSDSVQVMLTAQPDSEVTIQVTAGDPGEATVDPTELVFSPATWNTPQMVTVTGVDDDLIDGDQTSTVTLAIDDANSDDNFDAVPDQNLSVVTTDDGDLAGLAVTETTGSTQVSESGTTDSIEVALTAQPDSTVVVLVSSSDTGEFTVDVDALTFEPATWNIPQTVTITGVDDPNIDGDQSLPLTLAIDAANSDDQFDALENVNVSVTIVDDDTPGILVTPLSGLVTSEAGDTATFQIVLKQLPDADVTINLTSDDTTEATVSPSSLTFTLLDWNGPQIVTVTGVDDSLLDGDVAYTIVTSNAISTDLNYHDLEVADVSGVNQNDDVADLQITETDGSTRVSESGTTDTIDVRLTAQPTNDVVVLISSSDPGEAAVDPAQLTFTPANWDMHQTIVVSGIDDAMIDGDQTVDVTLSIDAANSDDDFDGVPDQLVAVNVADFGDEAGFEVSQTDGVTEVSEAGTTDSFDVVLTAQPTGTVVIMVSAGTSDEVTLDASELTFGPGDWNVPQTVTVTGVDDARIDGPQVTIINLAVSIPSGDPNYDEVAPQTLQVTTSDFGDVAGFEVTETEGSTQVSESGTSDSLSVVLTAEPDSAVVLLIDHSDSSEIEVDRTSLTFTPDDWNVPQLVTITGVDDDLIDGQQTVPLVLSIDAGSSDDHFDGVADQSIEVLVTDDGDVAGFEIVESDGDTEVSELGTTDTFQVTLTAEPASNVVLLVASTADDEATFAPTTLIFTPDTWDIPQTITVTGEDDPLIDGDQTTVLTLSVDDAVSDDDFDGVADQTVTVTTTDFGDVAGLFINETDGDTQVSESGTTDVIELALTAQPQSDVIVIVSVSDPTEISIDVSSLTFTAENWDVPQSIVVTGVDDALIDGDQTSSIVLAIDDTGSDEDFRSVEDQSVTVVTLDFGDVPGFSITETGDDTTVSESGTSDSFDVVLTAQPASDVVLLIVSNDTGEVVSDLAGLTFTPSNWDQPQTVTVTGVDDARIDGDVLTDVVLSIDAAASDDAFDDVAAQSVSVTTTDDGDTAGWMIEETEDETRVSETGTTDSFSVTLTAQPESNVVVLVVGGDPGEASVSPESLVFTPDSWDVPQVVTVTGVDDALIDGNQTSSITLSVDDANSDDAFDALEDHTLDAVTEDDGDTAGFLLTESGEATEVSESGTSDTFTVVLTAQPLTDVVISVTSGDSGEAVAAPATLTFTPATWDSPQTVTVTGVDDALIDGSQLSTITVSVVDADSDDSFDGLDDQSVTVTTTDSGDVAGLTVTETGGDTRVSETGTTDHVLVVLTAQPNSAVVVSVATDDADEVSADVTALTFTPDNWDAPQLITLTGVDDNFVDGTQTSDLVLAIDADASDDNFDAVADQVLAVETTDDDQAELQIVARQASQAEGSFGATTEFVFDVTLTGDVAGGLSVAFATQDGTATTADDDYVAASGTLDFTGTDGEVQTIRVTANGDAKVEVGETFTATLGELSNIGSGIVEQITVAVAAAEATIANDDSATVSIADVTAVEGNASTATNFVFEVTLSQAVQGGFRVSYATANGTATTADGDYANTSGNVEFQGTGGEVRTITVPVTADRHVERDELFSVTLGSLSEFVDTSLASSVTIADDSATGTIENDDTATVAFDAASSNVIEESGAHTVDVVLSVSGGGTLTESVSLTVSVVGGTAQSPADFVLDTGTVTFPAGATSGATQSVTLTITSDGIAEEMDESVDLRLALSGDGIGGAVSLGANDEHQVLITDDPQSASLSGYVWIDADNDAQRDEAENGATGESGLPGVRITLRGTTRLGESLELVAMTDTDGSYRFYDLPAGTYALEEEHPTAFVDGQDTTSADGAQVDDDRISQIELAPGEALTENVFYERGFRPRFVSVRLRLASTPPNDVVFREWNMNAAELNEQPDLVEAIRDRKIPSEVSGDDTDDNTSAGDGEGEGTAIHQQMEPGGEGEGTDQVPMFTAETDASAPFAASFDEPQDGREAEFALTPEIVHPSLTAEAHAPSRGEGVPLAIGASSDSEPASPTTEDPPPRAEQEDLPASDAVFAEHEDWLPGLGFPESRLVPPHLQ